MMTIQEAHIKAVLEFGDLHDNVFVQMATCPGDDPEPLYEIIIPGEYSADGDWSLGSGDSWEAAFQSAYEEIEKEKKRQKERAELDRIRKLNGVKKK